MESKITSSLFYIGLIAVVIAFTLSALIFQEAREDQIKEDLWEQTEILSQSYDMMEDPVSQIAGFRTKNSRITLIAPNGTVLFDSTADIAGLDNHADRPEVEDALQSGKGYSVRSSSTLLKDLHYCALRLPDGNILRISVETSNIYQLFWRASPLLVGIILFLLLLSIIFSIFLMQKMLVPIKLLANNISHPEAVKDHSKIYQELIPFIQEIQHQRTQNQFQLRELTEEKNKLQTLIQNMAEGMLLLDQEEAVLVVNDSALQYLGQTSFTDRQHLMTLSDIPQLNSCIHEAIHGNSTSQVLQLQGKYIQVFTNPVMNDDSQIGVICLMLDVTEKVQMEQMRQEFTANVSHELKTPLTSISGYAEMIATGFAKQEDVVHFAQVIGKEASRLLTLISDIIQLSELDESPASSQTKSVDLYSLAEDCLKSLEIAAQKKNILLLLEGEPTSVYGVRHQLWELIYNLCDNAIRYTPSGGRVTVTVKEQKVTVKDNGIGIPKEHQARIFERFYRVDKSRSKETGGTGLGLSIVKHIAERHHAAVILHSEEQRGTEIAVDFTAH